MIWTRSEQVAAKYGFEKKEQFVFVKYIRKEQIESIKIVQKPIKEFEERGIKEIIIPKEEIDEWLSAIE
jgi:aspartate ammonia-lyase